MTFQKLFVTLAFLLLTSTAAHADVAGRVQHKKIAGVDVFVYPMAVKQVVTIMGALPAGDAMAVAHREHPAAAALTAMMLNQGTTQNDKFAIAQKLGSVGATLNFRTQSQSLQVTGRCLSKDLPGVLGLLAEQLRRPAFAPSELDKTRQRFIGEVQNQKDQVEYRAEEAFKRQLFPEGDPNRDPSLDELQRDATALQVADLRAFHRKYYGPNYMTLVLVGDVRMASVEATLASAFKGWTGGVPYVRDRRVATDTGDMGQTVAVEMPGKTSTVLLVGQATGLRYQDQDTIPLELATAVLGSGFTGRLMHSVRDTEGLTYGISAGLSNNTFTAGAWGISGTFAPEFLERGIQSTQRELNRWWSEGITQAELQARKANLIGAYKVSLSDTQGVAYAILQAALQNKGMDWLDQYPKAVATLTLEDVNTAIRRHLDPKKMVTLKIGTLPKT